MTDYSELIKQLRISGHPTPSLTRLLRVNAEAADALEAQAEEIAELEAMHRRDVDCIKRASIRISELEAENKALREALKRGRPSISRPGGSIPWDELAALDAAWAARIERSMERSDE